MIVSVSGASAYILLQSEVSSQLKMHRPTPMSSRLPSYVDNSRTRRQGMARCNTTPPAEDEYTHLYRQYNSKERRELIT